jgi:Cell Wall Hydrolase
MAAVSGLALLVTSSTALAQSFDPAAAASAENGRARAITCLAQAISYEAGNEPISGQEAVAQVILNRLRHPAFPKTICGVVYQGSERRTGCQFTFTCDGSLKRPRSPDSLAQAARVAERVLDGLGTTLIGGATHYHANYVSPYWAPSLVKIIDIGAHKFYRMPGAPDFPARVTITQLGIEPLIASPATPTIRAEPNGATFAPWGLPTLVIAPSGQIKALGQ